MQSLTSTPNRPKHPFSSALPSARRASTGTVSTAPSTPSLPIKTPSRPRTSTSTGIPAFRSLRSLLPFGPSKHATPASPAVPSTPSGSKNPFYSFGSVRRSMQREGKASQDVELPPVISIDQVTRNELEGSAVRRSVSCSMLQPIDGIQEGSSNPFQGEDAGDIFSTGDVFTRRAPILRTPSPGPPISAELSTILEADSSGISKYIPSKNPSRAPSPEVPAPAHEQSRVINTSVLDLTTSHLEDEVLGAMRSETSSKPQGWNIADKAIIIDADVEDSDSLNLNALDPDLAAILSPHRFPIQRTNANVKKLTLNSPQRSLGQPINDFSNSPQFVLAPSPIISGDPDLSSLSPLHLRLPRQQSSLPRLRSPISPSHHSPHSPTPSTVVPSSSASDSTFRGEDARKTNPPSPFTVFSHTSAPPSPFTPPKTISSPLSIPTASMTTLSRRSSATKAPSSVLTLVPSQPASSSTNSRLRTPFMKMPRPGTQRPATSPEAHNNPDAIRPFTPSSTSRLASRPSFESTSRKSGSFDLPRRSLSSDTHHFEHTSSARPSLDTLRGTATDTENAKIASAVLERARKRSMSVQDRIGGRHALGVPKTQYSVGEADRQGDLEGVTEFGEQRSSSSQSMRIGRRLGGGRTENMANGSAPVTEWLGPRTVKAFKAAGLLDFGRDQQPHSDRNGPGSLNSTHGRFASMRSASEYNARAPSRLAVSEAGGSSTSRRGSVSGGHGLMESPTFTVSSGSRDTPRSASTAPTSASGSSLAFSGRDRDREREEIRELKDKHASETEALLGALSDSQRTTKILREENGNLRDRLEQAEAEVHALRRVVGELTKETGDLRVQIQMLKSKSNDRLGAIIHKSGFTVSPHIENVDNGANEWSNPVSCKVRDKLDVVLDFYQAQNGNARIADEAELDPDSLGMQAGPVMLSSTPVHKRRFSNTSSVFPVPPANMTMLLHDHEYDQDTGSLNDSLDHSQFSPSTSTPRTLENTVTRNVSLTSAMSISPSTANFSITTGSPASLFLRPEHELHLGDMDSLELGIIHNADAVRQDVRHD